VHLCSANESAFLISLREMDRYQQLAKRDLRTARVTASPEDLENARSKLVDRLSERGLGDEGVFFFFSLLSLAVLDS
jgi:hypothetical protein